MARQEKKKKVSIGKIVGLLVALSVLDTELLSVLIVLGILGAFFWLGFRGLRALTGGQKPPGSRQNAPAFDDCPKPVCFHRDKGVHHLYNGRERDPWDRPNREIDPWDRPDIDIRQYQHQ